MFSVHSSKKGFTLIEVVIAVGIIATLATIFIVGGSEPRKKTRDTQRINDIKQIQLALRLYKDAYGYYPGAEEPSDNLSETIGEEESTTLYPILKEFMPSVPGDPSGSLEDNTYEYIYATDVNCEALASGTYIVLYATEMEQETSANLKEICDLGGAGGDQGYGVVLQKRNP